MAGSRSKEEDARAAWKEELRQAQQGAAAAAGEDGAARGGLAAADNDDDAIDVAPFFNRAFECLRPGNQLQSYYRYRGGRGRGKEGANRPMLDMGAARFLTTGDGAGMEPLTCAGPSLPISWRFSAQSWTAQG